MNSRFSMILAGLLLVGALLAGYWGLVLTRPAPAVAPGPQPSAMENTLAAAEDQTLQSVVVLAHDVPAHVVLTAADLNLEKLRTAPAGRLTRLDQAIGRTPWRPLTAGTWLDETSFTAGGPLARMIRPDERALAITVDEVIGAAGQLSPGDYVDALLFLGQDAGNPEQSAQVVIPALRVIGVGTELGLTNDGKPAAPPPTTAEEKAQQAQRRSAARTVTLAVPQQLLSRLMLATQAGTLRLAVRSADEELLSRYWAGENITLDAIESANRDLYQFTQLALSAPPKSPPPTPSTASNPRSGIEVIRGNQVSQQTP